ncbi:hypothetical protein DPMN_164042 [Dreissena polymorpha]|uniref:Uncharacterized protein n=1 Tax=Dreissena polymorpha TaxID=45954 RepID=A0A9D4IRZ8_DREPO|nr:hypothetical protein DPMN_164042 [Dreissena polymorpha]
MPAVQKRRIDKHYKADFMRTSKLGLITEDEELNDSELFAVKLLNLDDITFRNTEQIKMALEEVFGLHVLPSSWKIRDVDR